MAPPADAPKASGSKASGSKASDSPKTPDSPEAPDSPQAPDSQSLDALVHSASTLLAQLQAVLADIHSDASAPPPAAAPPTPNPLALARDSAALIRAHATKLALLLVHEPFTPSALAAVVAALVAGPVPALAAARAPPTVAAADRGALPATGILWDACDDVIALAAMGVAGFFVHKTGQWRDTLKDVMRELREWGDEEPDDEEHDDDDDDDDEHASAGGTDADSALSAQDMIDQLVNSQRPIPRHDPDRIRPRLDSSLKRLRLVTLLYDAAIKRRLSKLPPVPAAAPDLPPRLDALARALALLPDRFEDFAAALDRCVADARAAADLLTANWDGAPDDFSPWIRRFQAEIKAADQPSRQ